MQFQGLKLLISSMTIMGMLAACGGSVMSGGGNNLIKKKERRETPSDGDEDAKDPQVVTGAYLSCERSTKDFSDPGTESVGCSVIPSDGKSLALAASIPKFYRSVSGGPYKNPTKVSTSSGYQALFTLPKSETANSRFIASVKNKTGYDEVSCEGSKLPCKKPISLASKPTYFGLDTLGGVWRVDSTWSGMTGGLGVLLPDQFCTDGKNGDIRFGDAPSGMPFSTTIEKASSISIERSEFCVKKTRAALIPTRSADTGFSTKGNGCLMALMEKKVSGEINLNHTNSAGYKINKDRFVVIFQESQQSDSNLEAALADFACP